MADDLRSHYRDHKRRFLAIGPKLVRFLESDAFTSPGSCSENLQSLLLLSRRDGRFQVEKADQYSDYGSDRNMAIWDEPGWWEQHPDWHVLYEGPRSVHARFDEYRERCLRKTPRR